MAKTAMPKSVRAAINAQAFRIAQTQAYKALRVALEKRAQGVMQRPGANVRDAILILESSHDFEALISSVAGRVQTYALAPTTDGPLA